MLAETMTDAMKYDGGSNIKTVKPWRRIFSLYNKEMFAYPERNMIDKDYFSVAKRSKYLLML
jgi:hypothetical protein